MKTDILPLQGMTARQAAAAVNELLQLTVEHMGTVQTFRLEWGRRAGIIRDQKAWKALNFSSWAAFVEETFGVKKRWANRLIQAAQVGTIVPTPELPNSQLLALAGLSPDDLAACLEETGPERTAAQIEEYVRNLNAARAEDAADYDDGETAAQALGEEMLEERFRQGWWKKVRWETRAYGSCLENYEKDGDKRWLQAGKHLVKGAELIEEIVGKEPPREKKKPVPRHTQLVG